MLNHCWTVFKKEVIENLRDRRTMLSSVLMGALIGPVIMLLLTNLMVNMQTEKATETLRLPVVNMQYAKDLDAHFRAQGVEVIAWTSSPETTIKEKTHDVVLEISPNFADAFAKGQPAIVKLYYDDSAKGATSVSVNRVKQMLSTYSAKIAQLRLQLRGVSPELLQVIAIETHDQSTQASRGAQLFSFLPYFLIIGLFVGSMYLAIDTTAGEKERKSMEPLFLNPISRRALMLGKLAATVLFGLMTLILTLLAFRLTLPFFPFDALGMDFQLNASALGWIFAVLAPMALLAGAMQTIIATFAKSFREAQTYVSLLTFVPMLPSMMLMILPIKEKLWMMLIPIMGQNVIIDQLLRGEAVSLLAIALAILSTLATGIGIAWLAIKLYQRESMLFGE